MKVNNLITVLNEVYKLAELVLTLVSITTTIEKGFLL